MDIMTCVELVQRNGILIILFLLLIGAGGVGLHIWWSSRLAFFDFRRADSTNKNNLKRLFYPLIPVSIFGLLTPIVAVLISSEFRKSLEDPEIIKYLKEIWIYILPVVGTGIGLSAVVCAFVSIITNWIFGLILYYTIGRR